MMNNVQHNHQYISKNIFIYFCSPHRGRIFVSNIILSPPHLYYTENGKNRALVFHFFSFFLKRFTIKSDLRLSIQSKNDVNNAFFRIKTCMYSQKILPLQRKLELFTS